jgi:hypothetical protein
VPTGVDIVLELHDVDAEYRRVSDAGWKIAGTPANEAESGYLRRIASFVAGADRDLVLDVNAAALRQPRLGAGRIAALFPQQGQAPERIRVAAVSGLPGERPQHSPGLVPRLDQ